MHLSAPLEILPVAPILQLAVVKPKKVKPKRAQPAQGEGPAPKPEKKKAAAEGKARAKNPKGKEGKGGPFSCTGSLREGTGQGGVPWCHCQRLHPWVWQGGS